MASEDRPDGPLSGLMYDMAQQANAVQRHALAEGHDVPMRAALDVHGRASWPYMRAFKKRVREVRDQFSDAVNGVRA